MHQTRSDTTQTNARKYFISRSRFAWQPNCQNRQLSRRGWLPRLERTLRALAPKFDQLRRAVELVDCAGVARAFDHEVGTIGGEAETGEVFLHQVQRLGERVHPAGLGFLVVVVADGALDE